MKLLVLLSIIIACPVFCEDTITITDKEVHEYWDVDDDKMSRSAPNSIADVIARHGGSIRFKFTYLIDVNGRPKNFTFISAEPKSAEIEQKHLKKRYLFYRYKHAANSDFKGATFVEADLYWWKLGHNSKSESESKHTKEKH